MEDGVDGLLRWADRAALERFHLYGHSGGGAVALAFTAAHAGRVLSLTLDEAAFDFSNEMRADLAEHRQLANGWTTFRGSLQEQRRRRKPLRALISILRDSSYSR
jgi:pimeloyl-ACP methyl ester carboxylesterase